MVKQVTRKRRGRRARAAGTISPPRSRLCQAVNVTVTASTWHYWTASKVVVEGTTQQTLILPLTLRVTIASTTPCTCVFGIWVNDAINSTTEQWVVVWQSALTVISNNTRTLSASAPRGLDPREDYRWGILSSGTPLVAGYVSFIYCDPVGT